MDFKRFWCYVYRLYTQQSGFPRPIIAFVPAIRIQMPFSPVLCRRTTVSAIAQAPIFYFPGGITTMQKIIELHNIIKEFDGERILDNIDLDIYDKEFITILGPSGCGKTTTLRIIGGFETPDSGECLFDGKRINDIPAYRRNVNTVFQKYALFPHLNVFENIAFALRLKKVPEDEIIRRVREMLDMVALRGFEHKNVNYLSGGQQQRVAIARALISHPRVLLLDEPLGALDLKLRKDMQNELKNIQQRTGITFIYVTHDQEEALTMSDTVVVMADGKIQQVGTPIDIYNEPVNAFVADFIGDSNIVDGVMLEDASVSPARNLSVLTAALPKTKQWTLLSVPRTWTLSHRKRACSSVRLPRSPSRACIMSLLSTSAASSG